VLAYPGLPVKEAINRECVCHWQSHAPSVITKDYITYYQ